MLKANDGKELEIEVEGNKYCRYAIQTHYVQIGENYINIIEKYVKPVYKEGDFISISEKIISLCQKRVIYKKDMKVSRLAKFLSKFAMSSDAGIGVDSPYKMQVAIDLCGRFKVIYAAIRAGIGKLFKKKGIFYDIVGQEISGLDGFYGKVFPEYSEFGIRIPENPDKVCNEIYQELAINSMIVDANDFNVEILGKSSNLCYNDEVLKQIIKDNPAGQSKQLTPIILIRKMWLKLTFQLSKRMMMPIYNAYKRQTEFVANASHELRTPLTIIQAKQELLLQEPESKIIDKSEDINLTLKETRRLSKMIKELMALARSDSNEYVLNKEEVNIDKLIQEIVKPYKDYAELEKKTIKLELNYKREIKVDKNKITELLIILLDNAIKYTGENDTITIKTYSKDGKCNIEVADTGIGISDEGLKRVFERFYREDKARTRETGGTGLGLSIAHTIVTRHKGSIRAMHNKPRGTIFLVRI